MISLVPTHHLTPPGPLDNDGGFLWWYLDLTDSFGNGMVLIWSFGLPFLPGLASAARHGQPASPAAHPSLNVVLYRAGKPDFYLLQTIDPAQATWDGDRWQMGGLSGQRMVHGERLILWMELDCAVPGTSERLVGRVNLCGTRVQGVSDDAPGTAHVWSPLVVAAIGHADLQCGTSRWQLTGRAYHDRNFGDRPLHTLGIDRWWWLHLALPDRELIGYHLLPDTPNAAPRSVCMAITHDGKAETIEPARFVMRGWRWSLLGLSSPRTITFTPPHSEPVTAHLVHRVDDGPFYQRFQIEAVVDEQRVRGFAEQVVPGRIDRALYAPFVRMRVHRHDGRNSMWLPLFTGPRTGRLSRLLGIDRQTHQLPGVS